jgi:DNA-binding winged helix-turn-helix (wHTH) protein
LGFGRSALAIPTMPPSSRTYRFGDFTLVVRGSFGGDMASTLSHAGRNVTLEPQALRLLVAVVEARGTPVTRGQAQLALWPDGSTPADVRHSIDVTVRKIRQVLQRSKAHRDCFETIRKQGFRIGIPVEVEQTDPPVEARAPARPLETAATPELPNPTPAATDIALEPAGHALIGGTVSVAFGVMVGLALLVEVAYEWPVYRHWVVPVGALAGVSAAGASLLIIARMRRLALAPVSRSLGASAALLFGWSALVAFAIAPWLPDVPLVPAEVQTMAARVGWVKSVGEALFLPMLALVPLHTVYALEELVRAGRAAAVRALLLDRPDWVYVPVLYVPGRVASTVWLIDVGVWVVLNLRLFESLERGEYYGLFVALNFARVAIGLLTLTVVLVWYLASMTRLRHASMAGNT